MKKFVAGASIIGLVLILGGCEFSLSENAVNEIYSTYKQGCPFVSGQNYIVGTIPTDSPSYKYTDNTYNYDVIDDGTGYTMCRLRWVDNGDDRNDDHLGQTIQLLDYFKMSPNRYVALVKADTFSFSRDASEKFQRAYIVEVTSEKINFIGCVPPEDSKNTSNSDNACIIRSVADLKNVTNYASNLTTEFFLKKTN